MNRILRRSSLSVAGLVLTGGAVVGPAVAAHAATGPAATTTGPTSAIAGPAERTTTSPARWDRSDAGDRRDDRDARDTRRERALRVAYQAQPNFYYCGPAATRIALSADGKLLSQDELAEKLGTTVAGTNSAEDVTRVLNELTGGGYRTTEIRDPVARPEQIERLRADVVDALDAGDPVVANIKGGTVDTDGREHSYPGGHYLTVVAYRDGGDTVRIADPADPVGEYWLSTERLAHWIAERGYSS
ncbi:C39 family peptidase [Micromonospora cathayae]|uniref:C39 family peptidase n=1 Tax=Micromonospora cathayae TaxID=3028804 RepID=A0ABY7ZU39_9ACTN|nr:C39 family peptidase [Micromonospora sp. HUAS 3]WDZ86485.1 C39 family peptidase [Micromonospora sp. HUAS 3]